MKFLSVFIASVLFITTFKTQAQPFIHPGINQTSADLSVMKSKLLKGEEPYISAFESLKAATDTSFNYKAYTHVLRGPYGRPNIGGDDLSRSANMAYNYALMWYITQDRNYANKAIEIINAWSPRLWDFDYNDAKLLAAWTGHVLCNAAEILRYTNAGWKAKDVDAFSNMLMTVYYPLMRHYFPQANGNWDGAIIHSIIAIAIFMDNRPMFNNAVDHFLHSPVNGSLFKYIYPDGQCQETARDQAHVQLGLGEFAGAAQIAYTQGVDLFSIGNNRLALGYEYTAGFILGEDPHAYGVKSERAKTLRDDYEYVYRHYTAKGVEIPFTKQAADSVRSKASRSILTSVRFAFQKKPVSKTSLVKSTIGYVAGAGAADKTANPANTITVNVGDDVQEAINKAASIGQGVLLKAGIHTLQASLKIPSGTAIYGEGLGTVLFLDPKSANRDVIINAEKDLQDITIENLVIECSNKTDRGTDPNSSRSFKGGYNRGGIVFRADHDGQMKHITLKNITVQNATYNGVFISGAENVTIEGCDFTENGSNVVPGPKLQHNLLLSHCRQVKITGSRLDTSPYGSGISLDHCSAVSVSDCEIARNGYHGILVAESNDISIRNSLIEGNDNNGVMVEFLFRGSKNISIQNNQVQYNAGYGVETVGADNALVSGNRYAGNGSKPEQQKLSTAKQVVLGK